MLVLEQNGFLGGSLTACRVGPMMTFHARDKQVIKGIMQELVEDMAVRGYSVGHIPDTKQYTSTITPFQSEGLKLILDEKLAEAGCQILFHTFAGGVERKESRIAALTVCNKDGIHRISAEIYVDATGDGDIAFWAGAPMTKGRLEDGAARPMTMKMKYCGVDTEKLRSHVLLNPGRFPVSAAHPDLVAESRAMDLERFEEEFRKVAELAGDKPLPIALAFLVVASLIFASSNGLGMVILVGTIIIPIMISAGVSPMTAGAVLLFANGIGVTFSVGTLGVYIDTLGLPLETVTSYSWLCGIPLIIVAVAWIVCSVKGGKVRKAWAMPAGEPAAEKNVRSIALISPLIPIVLVFVLKMELVPSIIIGILITLILSTPKNPVQVVAGAFGGIRHEPCCSNGGAPSGFQCAGGLRSDKLSQCVGIRLYEGRCKRVSEKDDSLDYGLHTGGADRCQFCHYAVDKADMVLIWGKKIQRKGRQRFFPRNVCGPDGRVNLFVRA